MLKLKVAEDTIKAATLSPTTVSSSPPPAPPPPPQIFVFVPLQLSTLETCTRTRPRGSSGTFSLRSGWVRADDVPCKLVAARVVLNAV